MLDEEYLEEIRSDVSGIAESLSESHSSAFAEYAAQMLVSSGELGAPIIGAANGRTMQISGVDWDDERRVLSAFTTIYSAESAVRSFSGSDLERTLQRILSFIEGSVDALSSQLLQSDPARDVSLTVAETLRQAEKVRLIVVTNMTFSEVAPPAASVEGISASVEVWDLRRLASLRDPDATVSSINIDARDLNSRGIEAMGPYGSGLDYTAYLAVFTGDSLADLYAEYGPRLLELNVRSFLQARNKVNKGIQETLKSQPHRFLAYNNGLSITAAAVERATVDGRLLITRLEDVQIVNGGQTTASLYHAKYRDGVDLSDVIVQAKLSVLNTEVRSELAPKVSLFANSQNPIRMADFSANDPFHVELQRLSRDCKTPENAGSQRTSWFYERSRGQYADLMAACRTPTEKAAFREANPTRQRFVKTDVAKLELLWDQRPHVVALGGEKHFNHFMQLLRERPSQVLPDETYFHHLVAKAILWRATDDSVAALNLGGYKAQAVAYTMALIANRTAQRVDLEQVWTTQKAPEAWNAAVVSLAPLVHAELLRTAGTRNVTEWSKRPDCWEAIQQIEWTAPSTLISERPAARGRSATAPTKNATSLPASETEIRARTRVISFGSNAWFELSAWAKDTNNLAPWQRSIAFSLGRLISGDREPSEKQSIQGERILDEAERLGFQESAGVN